MDWQSGISTVQERNKYLLETGLFSDVQFLVGTGKILADEKEEKLLINAHKLILSSGSSIFVAQFRFNESSGQDNNAPIVINDIPADAFKAMLHYLYTNEFTMIKRENIVGVYSAAKKYLLHDLAEECIEMTKPTTHYIFRGYGKSAEIQWKMFCDKNIFDLLKLAKLHEDEILIKRCFEFIDQEIGNFDDQVIMALSKEEMGELLERDTLQCPEFKLFFYLDKWAEKQCENEGILEPTGEQKRAKMGDLLNLIRFPMITPMDFINEIATTYVLSKEEIAAMLIHYSDSTTEQKKAQHPLPFSIKPRAIPPRAHNKLMDKYVVEKAKKMGYEEILEMRWN